MGKGTREYQISDVKLVGYDPTLPADSKMGGITAIFYELRIIFFAPLGTCLLSVHACFPASI